ncbi:phage exclusion protein Lit family protein [Xanthobacter autotrophicus]|uniref:phage exclusion protein Lit family protein n=1 Tax=Xanthobacter autotrophicus TaxID=280 RepID=UPI00372C60AE
MRKPNLKPGDICACGSRRTYGECHQPIYEAAEGKAVPVAQEIYAREWGVNSDHYGAEGLYTTLASELVATGGISRVLDIGCGLGQGLEALSEAIGGPDRLIAGVDENPYCLAAAAARLGLPAEAVASPRVTSQLGLRLYDAVPDATPIAVQGDRVLVQADVLVSDGPFEKWLRANGQFDAVTLWFTGGHKARSLTKVAERIKAESDEDFRWAIEDQVMDIAIRHLRPGGLIQIVTRAAGNVEALRLELEAHRRGAIADFPVELVAVKAHPYAEPTASGAIVMVGAGGVPVMSQLAAFSTLLRAREVSTELAVAGLFKRVNRTPFNIAPERGPELSEAVFGSGDWTLNPRASKADFWAVPDDKAVYLTWAGLGSLWCVAFVAYSIINAASAASRAPGLKNASAISIGQLWHDVNLQGYVDYAKLLIKNDRPWPPGLELPDADAPLSSPQGRLNNLIYGALSWILLHEIGHAHLEHIPYLSPPDMVRQEVQADDFATDWVLKEAGVGLAREFRVLMVITALAWLFLFEQAGGQDTQHPPAIRRFAAAARSFKLGERSAAYENGYYFLKAIFDPGGPVPPKRPMPREAFEAMAERLEELFPVRGE